jgi:hypothetical protein
MKDGNISNIKVKIFKGLPHEVEHSVNEWLLKMANEVSTHLILQSSSAAGSSGGMWSELQISIWFSKL